MLSRANLLDPGIRVISGRYGIKDMELQRDEMGWLFRCGVRTHRIPETRAWQLAERGDYGSLTELVSEACRAISMGRVVAKRRREFRTKQRSILARTR